MARPKLNTPPKVKLTLTVTEETRRELTLISEHHNQSISSLLSEWAEAEAERITPNPKGKC